MANAFCPEAVGSVDGDFAWVQLCYFGCSGWVLEHVHWLCCDCQHAGPNFLGVGLEMASHLAR